MNLKRRLVTGFATGAILLNTLMPVAFADTTISINGNGSDSDNNANVSFEQSTTVVQNNDAQITNDVRVDANTGDNEANDNTGGDVSVQTGDVDAEVSVTNVANKNVADVECCTGGDKEIEISKNGSDSDNTVDFDWKNNIDVFQENDANIRNDVRVEANTGDNEANDNTDGDVSIETGDADVSVSVTNMANANFANVGNGDNGGDVSLRITGNGSDSDNEIDLDFDSSIVISQDNDADIDNDIRVDADTGDNEAEDNTGDDVSIETGDIDSEVDVHNMVNFNWADLDCGCLLEDLTVEISKNGADSDNSIEADFNFNDDEEEGVFQENDINLDNDLEDLEFDTGDNEAEDNTGDPELETGDIDSMVDVHNFVNANVVGDMDDLDLSDLEDFLAELDDVEFVLDLEDLLAVLHMMKV